MQTPFAKADIFLSRIFDISVSSAVRLPMLFMLLFNGLLTGQTPSFNFQKLGSEEGLNNANIFNIEQHRNGLIYVTTQNGIYYYDGYTFSKLDIDSLKSNALQNSVLKGDDELYLSIRDEGIATYNLRTHKYFQNKNLVLKDNNADNFIISGDYAYILTSEIRLVTIQLSTGKVIKDDITMRDRNNRPYCIFMTAGKRLLVGRSNGVYELNGAKQKEAVNTNGDAIRSITEGKDGTIYLGGTGRIYISDGRSVSREVTPVYKNAGTTFQPGGEKSINKIVADDYGRIWFTAYPGESLFLYQNNTVYDVFEGLDIPPSLINCIYKDSEQNIWVGTWNDGAYLIQNTFFNSIGFSYNRKSLNVNQVYLKDNLLVAATSNGLYGLNLLNNQAKILSHPDEVFIEPVNSITPVEGAIYYCKSNQISMSPSIFMDSRSTYKFKPVAARQFYPIGRDSSVIADWQANILLSNANGSKTIDTLISFTDYRIAVNSLLKTGDDLYIATSNGLFKYNFAQRSYTNLVRAELNFNINDLAIIDGKLYAAHEAGITDVYGRRLIQEAGRFSLNSVRKIRKTGDEIWLATLDGVYICNMSFEPLKVLNKSSGLPSNSVNDIAFNETSVGIATARGVSITEFRNILRHSSRLKPVTISNVAARGRALGDEKQFTLAPDDDDISISFHSPLFRKPNRQLVRYRLDGSEWKVVENVSSLNFPSLPGGQHKVEISVSADNILWSENTVIDIYKEEKLTEKQILYWLITVGALLLLSIVSFVWIRRVKMKARKRLQEEQQVNLLKHQAMNSLLSPHFIFNSLTSIQNYINTNNSLRASEYLAKFSRLIRMIIEKASLSHISLHDELARLTYYLELEKERFKNKFDYVINIDEDINTHSIMIPNMIIQPHVENCILHGILPKHSHGTLGISFSQPEGKKLLITIEDDGIGLIKAAEQSKTGHKSLGTSTIRDILEINSKLTGKAQKVTMLDKSTIDPAKNGTIITIELEL